MVEAGLCLRNIPTNLAKAKLGIAREVWLCPNKARCCCLCLAMISAVFPGLAIGEVIRNLTFTISDFPGLPIDNVINKIPHDIYVLYEAAVTLKIVVQTISLQHSVLSFFMTNNCHDCHHR